MKSFRILAGFMVVLLVAFMSLSAAAYAKNGDDDSGSGNKKGKKIPKHARVLQTQINDNKTSIENIQLTPGPQGDQGPAGADGTDGADGAAGLPGADSTVAGPQGIQGPQGDPGVDSTVAGPQGIQGPVGSAGADGSDGLTIQGPQGDPGQSGIGDMNTTCDSTTIGMIRYNTDNSAFEGCDGTAWVSLSTSGAGDVLYAIGDEGPAGGIVFYITNGGVNGLEAAQADQDNGNLATWYQAKELAEAYGGGGYLDWRLPSKGELNLLYQKRAIVGGFGEWTYWTETESSSTAARSHFFQFNLQMSDNKLAALGVRAVRAF